MACYCCVLGCKNNNHKPTNKHFFRFPKHDEKRVKLWTRFARRKVNSTSVICEDHFESYFVVQKDKIWKLNNEAVPTIYFEQHENEIEKKIVEFNGEDYIGQEADKMRDQEAEALLGEQWKINELHSRCRFCTEIKEELIEISSFATYNIDIKAFLQFLDLHVIDNDFIPQSVCEECFNQVLLLDSFIVKCRSANQWLWEETKKLKTFKTLLNRNVYVQGEKELKAGEEIEEEIIEQSDENSYSHLIQECDSESEQKNEMESQSMFVVTYVEDPKQNSENQTSFQQLPIINPNCNRFTIKNYDCEVCQKTFAGLRTFKNHICDVPEIRCNLCDDIFQTAFELKSHQQHLHRQPLQKNRNFCSNCKTVITGTISGFKKHKAKCNRDVNRDFQCKLCEKIFSSLHKLSIHQMFHKAKEKSVKDSLEVNSDSKETKKKPQGNVICDQCGKSYTTEGDRRRHFKLKHTERTENFTCEFCNRSYPTKTVLKDHIRNTHIIDEVACTFCGKIFRNRTHLKKHMVYHDESKKIHKCLLCPNQPGFISKVGLIRHQARHAKNQKKNQFKCDICVNYNFHTSFQLQSHMKHVHGMDQSHS